MKYPFSALRRRMGTLCYEVKNEGLIRLHEKGAPEAVFAACSKILTLNVILLKIFDFGKI